MSLLGRIRGRNKSTQTEGFHEKWLERTKEEPHTSLLFERVRTVSLIASLALCSAVAGSSVGAELLLQPKRHLRVNPLISSIKLKPAVPMQEASALHTAPGASSLETAVALNSMNIEQIIKQNQVSIDDRQQLHALIQSLAATEVNHYNILSDRMNVNDARVMTIGWILGVLFTLSQAIVVFFHLDKRRSHREAQPAQMYVPPPPPYQYQPPAPLPPQEPPAPARRKPRRS